jgi:glutaconate CoA-transferase subunit B
MNIERKSMTKDYADDYTVQELMASFISHEIRDGERVAAGAGLHVPRAGVLLAHLMHGPNIEVFLSFSFVNLIKEPVLAPTYTLTDFRACRFAESYMLDHEVFDAWNILADTFIVGGLQVDKFGNTNLIGTGKDHKQLRFRGPGPIGTTSMGTWVDRFYLFVTSHDKRILVDKVDFISCLGYGEGPGFRESTGMIGGGPKYCITPLCIMDFEERTKQMRLKSVHPGITVDQVVENTGFELGIPENVPETKPPTREEIEILRTRIDVEGKLRGK